MQYKIKFAISILGKRFITGSTPIKTMWWRYLLNHTHTSKCIVNLASHRIRSRYSVNRKFFFSAIVENLAEEQHWRGKSQRIGVTAHASRHFNLFSAIQICLKCFSSNCVIQPVGYKLAWNNVLQGRTQGGVGVNPPPWALYFTKTLLPAQRRLIVFAYFLLVNLST